MKKNILIFIIIISYLSTEAQSIKGALTGGFNLSQVDGDQVYGFKKFGLNAGPSAIIPLKGRFQLALELLYSQKGSSQRAMVSRDISDSTREYRLRLNYAEVPVLLQYADKNGMRAGVGFSYGRLVYVKEKQYNPATKNVEWDNVSLNDGTYNKNDFEILADLQLKLSNGIYADLRYSYSLAKIRERYYYYPFYKTRKQFNNLISFRIIWVINDENNESKSKIKSTDN